MTMSFRRAVLGCALGAVFVAAPTLSAASDQVASVTGGGTFLYAGTIPMQFGFSAVLHADGSASGAFHHAYAADGFTYEFWGSVTCMTFDEAAGRAWIGGFLTKVVTNDPEVTQQPGDDAWFRVLDAGTAGDRSTAMGFVGAFPSSAAYCATQPWPDDNARTHPVTAGQIVLKS
jgi:hypothetical protein